MTFPEQPNEAESLQGLFEMFAQTALAQMHTWATLEGMPQSIHQFVVFTDIGYRPRYEVKHEYGDLLLRHNNDPFGVRKSSHNLWENSGLHYRLLLQRNLFHLRKSNHCCTRSSSFLLLTCLSDMAPFNSLVNNFWRVTLAIKRCGLRAAFNGM